MRIVWILIVNLHETRMYVCICMRWKCLRHCWKFLVLRCWSSHLKLFDDIEPDVNTAWRMTLNLNVDEIIKALIFIYTAPQFWSRNDPKSHLVWKKLSPWALLHHNSADSPSNLTSNRPFFKFLMAFCCTHAPVKSRIERRVRWVWESFHSLLPMLPLLSLIILVPA